jgi:P4 family phage/plasmid primase-like protien
MSEPPQSLNDHLDAVWTSDEQKLNITVCRTCRTGLADCGCGNPVRHEVVLFVRGQGLNQPVADRLLAVMEEKSLPTVVASVAGEMVPTTAVPAAPAQEEAEPEYLDSKDMLGYLRSIFESGDWVDLQFIHQTETFTDKSGNVRKMIDNRYMTLEDALQPSTIEMISMAQDKGWNSYVAMNSFTAGLQSRKERDIANIRTVYVEFDENTAEGLARMDSDVEAGLVPAADFVLTSSPGKAYVIWLVTGFDVPTQKALNKTLQMRYGSDPQSVDAARVLRLPGTRNLKYDPTPVVTIKSEVMPHDRLTPADFKIEFTVKPPVNREAAPERVQTRMLFYEEACDNAGVDAGDLVQKPDGSYSYIVACPNYEEHTTGGKFDASVWISPSGCISFGCFHSHCADKDWKTYYRPWLEEQAEENGFEGRLKFGEASEVEQTGEILLNISASNDVLDRRQARPLTDLGNAERLVDLYGHVIRYCDKQGKWLVWGGIMWIPTGKTGPQRLMHDAVRAIEDEAQAIQGEGTNDTRSKVQAWARRSQSNNAISGAINQARAIPAIQACVENFDADRFLFNMQNGTYNLKTHEFRAHDKKDLITKASPVSYDPAAKCPRWLTFLHKSMPDVETRRFLQQAAGYSLTGDASEDCLFLNIGNGRNGKGVFLNTLKFIIGDYAVQANFDSFVARKGGGGLEIRSDIARMAGARFVLASENEQEARLAEGLLKTLTGSDTITARKLYQEEEEFLPQFKLFFAVNHEPRIIGTDDGIWSRIHLILWRVFIKPEEREPRLKEIFSREEAAGIFNWMLDGLRDYQQNRLVPSEEMIQATKNFRKNSDQIQRFFEEKCVLRDDLKVSSSSLYDAYAKWCRDTKEFQLKDRQFKSHLESQGWKSSRSKAGVVWHGIGVKIGAANGQQVVESGGNYVSF